MKPIGTFNVVPALPERLERLREVAYNLRWAWNHDTINLFRRLDSELWETTNHNPVLMLGTIDQARLEVASTEVGFLAHLDRVADDLTSYMAARSPWFDQAHNIPNGAPLVAYFSAEFGVTECLPIFAGGLGVLAGDHLKSASDLGVPLVGVGLLYQQGYFRQYLNEAGLQQEVYENNDFHNLPLRLEKDPHGEQRAVEVNFPDRSIVARVWRAQVGRVPLYLLDTNIPANDEPDRHVTHQLYGGDLETRIQQEMILGIGGYQALEALGLKPQVYHLNEGHSGFLALEHIRRLMQDDELAFVEAREAASAGLVFTTHTPVPAGHDYFPPDLVMRYLGDYARSVGLSPEDFLALGQERPGDPQAPFCMTTLALRLAAHSNAVSRLHGEVSRDMWQVLWPGLPVEEVPIGHVTNGVHLPTWISFEMNELYDRYLGPGWQEQPSDPEVWQQAEQIAPEELWRSHERRRERLVAFCRQRLRHQLQHLGAPPSEIEAADEVLDPEALTIGFARRFAVYKRATLLLRDRERLARILNAPGRPVQIIFAGKAHPQDERGKDLIRQILGLSREEPFRRRIVFIEDYDMTVARYLVQGVDVWLNTPRRPREASGTSGMKAAANGALNLSVLDGWWAEAYRPEVGWAIGRGEVYDDPGYQDQLEAEALYDLLERDVAPVFYERSPGGLPRRWIAYMKASIAHLCYFFNTHRMVREYTERFYLPAAQRQRTLTADESARARALAAWRQRIQQHWDQVWVRPVDGQAIPELKVGQQVHAQARTHLGALTPGDVRVEFYVGEVDADEQIVDPHATPMELVEPGADSTYVYRTGAVPCYQSGLHGYTVRVLPSHPDLVTPFLPGLITWAQT